jgi:hypothetical protein
MTERNGGSLVTGMRKSTVPQPHPPFVYLRDVLPSLAINLLADLRKLGERDLSEQISELRIYGRCCDASPCGRFYCLPTDERRELHRRKLTRTVGLEYTVANGRIVEVETLSPEVDAALKAVFPVADAAEHSGY